MEPLAGSKQDDGRSCPSGTPSASCSLSKDAKDPRLDLSQVALAHQALLGAKVLLVRPVSGKAVEDAGLLSRETLCGDQSLSDLHGLIVDECAEAVPLDSTSRQRRHVLLSRLEQIPVHQDLEDLPLDELGPQCSVQSLLGLLLASRLAVLKQLLVRHSLETHSVELLGELALVCSTLLAAMAVLAK